MIANDVPPPDRRARRRYAAWCGWIAVVLVVGGLLLARGPDGAWHDLGVTALGFGIGVASAAALILIGYEPRKRR